MYLALGVTLNGNKELLGMWLSQNAGAKFWLAVLTELQNRGIKDLFSACVDGLTGFPEAIESVFPQTRVQLCMVHMESQCAALRLAQAHASRGHRLEVYLLVSHRGGS